MKFSFVCYGLEFHFLPKFLPFSSINISMEAGKNFSYSGTLCDVRICPSAKITFNYMTTKNCIIIHGCPSDAEKAMDPETRTYDKHWIPWIKRNLIAKNIETETPLMPSPWQPNYEKFKAEFEKYAINENTILVGHSCGCAFLVRWLGETKTKIFKLFLVAPWKIPQEKRNGADVDFYTYPIDPTIRDRVNQIVMFTADDEEDDGKKSLKIFHEVLGGEVVELSGRGHYCLGDMKTEEFPELLERILQ